jgi:adenosine deaminase
MSAMPSLVDQDWIRAIPKAEVHVHIEGCIPFDLVGVDPEDAHFADLSDFLSFLDRTCNLVDSTEQLSAIGYGVAERAAACGVAHTDAIINPSHWPKWRDRRDELVAALMAGFRAGESDYGVTADLCWSLLRTSEPAEWERQVSWLVSTRPDGVVALSIDGNEAAAGRTGPALAPLFDRARAAGLHTCAHAGESSGPDGVRDAIDLLGAERVDHGVRAVEDPELVAELAARRIPLDICPTSNLEIGIVSSLAEHPLETLRRAGVAVTLNTDDPLLLGCDVFGEYRAAADAFAWDRADVAQVARTSILACFADETRRQEMLIRHDAFVTGD